MTLARVGASAGVQACAIGAGGTLTVTYTTDTGTWAEGDVLFGLIAGGAIDPNQAYRAVPSELGLSADWASFPSLGDLATYTSMTPAWIPVVHIVTAAEDGSATVTLTVTLTTVSTVDGVGVPGGVASVGYLVAPPGLGVRGSEGPCTVKLEYIPNDSGDTDFSAVAFGTPKTATFSDVAPYDTDWYSDSGGSVLLYASSFIEKASVTAVSTAWTGPTLLGSAFTANVLETGANDADLYYSTAANILAADADWAADVVAITVTPATINFQPVRVLLVLDSAPGVVVEPPETVANPFIQRSRRVNVRALPHSVNSGMFEQADILGP